MVDAYAQTLFAKPERSKPRRLPEAEPTPEVPKPERLPKAVLAKPEPSKPSRLPEAEPMPEQPGPARLPKAAPAEPEPSKPSRLPQAEPVPELPRPARLPAAALVEPEQSKPSRLSQSVPRPGLPRPARLPTSATAEPDPTRRARLPLTAPLGPAQSRPARLPKAEPERLARLPPRPTRIAAIPAPTRPPIVTAEPPRQNTRVARSLIPAPLASDISTGCNSCSVTYYQDFSPTPMSQSPMPEDSGREAWVYDSKRDVPTQHPCVECGRLFYGDVIWTMSTGHEWNIVGSSKDRFSLTPNSPVTCASKIMYL
jgi:hypothetical protein